MTTILLYIIIFGTVSSSLLRPWIGVLAYYTLALLFPQSLWPWIFGGLRVSYYVSIACILGFISALLFKNKSLDFSILKDKQNIFVATLWFTFIISYYFSPYGINESNIGYTNSSNIIENMNKVFLFYFVAIILINNKKTFHYLIIVFLFILVYYTYWANNQYLTGQMTQSPRLSGPGGIYSDENHFAMLYVVGTPFLYFMGNYYSKFKYIKYLLWGAIPFAWHAIFLTGSRGGLVGVAAVSLIIAVRSKSKILGLVILITLVIAFSLQGGDYLRDRSSTIVDYEGEGSAETRLEAWEAGWGMIRSYPLTGVGLGNFMTAFPDFSDKRSRVSHNTVIQLTSESGVLAGLMYLLIIVNVLLQNWRQRTSRYKKNEIDPLFQAVSDSVVCGLLGFFVCSIFLNLGYYEAFYYLLILSAVGNRLINSGIGEIGTDGRAKELKSGGVKVLKSQRVKQLKIPGV